MRNLGIVLMIAGIAMVGWFGYQYWSGMQSVTKINHDVVKVSNGIKDDIKNPFKTNDTKNNRTIENEQKSEGEKQTPNVVQTETGSYQSGDEIAKLVVPEINLAFDVFLGTGEDVLAKGVGMYDSKWTTPPDKGGHTVLSGHRDSVFQPVGDLVEGDSLYVRYRDKDYQYEINKIWITDEHDYSVIVPKDESTLTLSTCYPFHFIGSAPDRYIIQAKLVKEGELLNLG